VTYLTPLVAGAVGVTLLGERLLWNEPAGGVVVLVGIAVAQGRLHRAPRLSTGPVTDAQAVPRGR
jgi:drug/metabolite transporter (DMT)-like permease